MEQNAIYTSPLRHYREETKAQGETHFQVLIEESDLWITAPDCIRDAVGGNISAKHAAADCVNLLRGQIKAWIALHPEFAASLVPVPVPASAPEIVRRMAAGATLLGVGPMAAVAGTIAQIVAERLAAGCAETGESAGTRAGANFETKFDAGKESGAGKVGSADVLVENGGDIFMYSTKERTVALLADPKENARIGLRIAADDFPLAICSSSATIGHSLSFGCGELVSVRAQDAAVADAAATAFCNMLKTPADVARVCDRAAALAPHIDGVFAQCCGKIAVWGAMELCVI